MQQPLNPLAAVVKASLIASTLLAGPLAVGPLQAADLDTVQSYQIKQGPLSDALVKLGADSQMLLNFNPQLVAGKSTAGLRGEFSFETGLRTLLQGHGLTYEVIDARTVTIVRGVKPEQSQVHQSEKIVVTATRTEREVRTAPASVTVISGEELRQKPVADFTDILRQAVGVNVNQSQATGRREIQIRGMDAQYTLLLIDGRRTSSAEALIRGNDFDLSTLPIESIERVELIRGPMSALYGSDALGGVINIITRKATAEWRTSVGASIEMPQDGKGGDAYQQSLYTAGPLSEDLSLTFALDNSNRDGWKAVAVDPSNTLDETRLDLIEARDQINTRVGVTYDLDDAQALSLDLAYSDDSRFTRYDSWGSESYTDQDSQRLAIDLGYKAQFDKWGADLRLSQETIDLSDETDRYAVKKSEQTNRTLSGSLSYLGDRATTTVGVDLTNTDVNSDTDWVGSADVTQKALFAQSEIGLSDDVALTLGARVDDHDYFGREISPRAYLVYNPGNGLVIKGGYSEAFNAPDLFQLSDNYRVLSCGGSCYLTGNESLQAETAKSYEASINYEQANWDASLTYFDNRVDNLIERNFVDRFDVGLALPVIYYQNVSEASFKGWELAASAHLNEALRLHFNISMVDAINEDTNSDLLNRPDRNINVSLDWMPSTNTSVFAKLRHIGSMNNWSGAVPSYEVLDVGGHYRFDPHWIVKAGINNLNDKRLDEDDAGYEQVLLGRSFYVSASYSF